MTDAADEQIFDVVIVGSGAAGLTGALAAARRGLSVVVVEKAAHYGGSTARSGGAVWIPGNRVLREQAPPDSPAAAQEYLKAIIDDSVAPERVSAFLEHGPATLDLILDSCPLEMRWIRGYSDYYPEEPGGLARGRSIEAKPFDGHLLGAELARLEPDYAKAPLGLVVTGADYKWLNLLLRHPRGPLTGLRVAARYAIGRLRRQELLGRGRALVAGLRAGLLRAGVPVWLESPLTDLVVEDGAVRGVRVTTGEGGPERVVRARLGVLLASGGFERNEEMRRTYQREPITGDWTSGAHANTGDGIRAARALGAGLELMDDAWWGPSIPLPRGAWFCLSERSLPGSFMVNERGQRFVNEAAPYVEATHAMYGGPYGQGEGPGENIPAWLIFDQRYRDRYSFAALYPRQAIPRRWLESGAIVRAGSLAELAEAIGVPGAALAATAERFNGFARAGVDEDFHRGESAYDHYYGDPRNRPNPNLAELTRAPFYAARLVPGDLGTKGGVRTDEQGRVLREDGAPIEGLYAAGNVSSPVMGHTYAGPGATIGPAMTFAYLAVQHMADR